MGIKEREEKESTEELFETMVTEHFTELISDTNPQIKEAQRIPSRIIPKNNFKKMKMKMKGKEGRERKTHKSKSRHITFKLQK